jgi:hypothetical protein
MKILKSLAVISAFALSFNSAAVCKLSDKMSNSMITPIVTTSGTGWSSGFNITNISDVPITVKLEFTNVNGGLYTPSSTAYVHNFSSANNPLDLTNGAVLQPGELGQVRVLDPSTIHINVGYLSWESSTCIPYALMTTIANQYNISGKYSVDLFRMNNGMPF